MWSGEVPLSSLGQALAAALKKFECQTLERHLCICRHTVLGFPGTTAASPLNASWEVDAVSSQSCTSGTFSVSATVPGVTCIHLPDLPHLHASV